MIKMKKSLIISLLFASILFSINATASLTISPEQVSLDIIGGKVNTYNITLEYTDTVPALIFLSTNVKPDGDGFDITFSKNNIFAQPNEIISLTMTVKTSINIIPKPYTIQIIGQYEHTSNPPNTPTSATGTRGESEPTEPIPTIPEEPTDPETNDTIPYTSLPKPTPNNSLVYYIALVSGLVFILLIYIMRKKHKEVNEK